MLTSPLALTKLLSYIFERNPISLLEGDNEEAEAIVCGSGACMFLTNLNKASEIKIKKCQKILDITLS